MKLPHFAALLLYAAGILAVLLAPRLRAADAGFDQVVDRLAADWVRASPEAATSLQYFSGAEQDALDRQLTPITKAAREARVAMARRGLDELRKFDRAQLDGNQRISAAMLDWELGDVVADEPFLDYQFVFQQFSGLQVRLVNFLSQTHPIRNRRDVENYLARLALVTPLMNDGIAQARERGERGILPPKFIVSATIQQFDRFLSAAPRQNVLVTSLDERATKLADVSANERARFVAAAENLVGEHIIPAFRRAQALLQEQLPRTTDDAGVWRFPNGDKLYAQALHRLTTTNLTAQVHELGLSEVSRIEKEMDGLLRQLGYTDGSIKDRMEKLENDSQPSAEPDPRPMLLARFEQILRDAEKRAALIFDSTPRAPVIVKREPPFTEKSAAAHYTLPAKDGSRPGIFWAPLPGPKYEISGMRTLVYHEAVPGHHFQTALQQESTTLPKFRRDGAFGFISSYGEGWALYAEHLAAENGWYEGDVKGHLGQLNDELFRARRLVVDTGIHAMHWTRQQAIDYGIPPVEVDRYVVWPGQACSYKIGMLKILELRAKAQRELGPKFAIREFHNVVLQTGTVPLDALGQAIDDYIARAK
jgi:uncharacterized protein (DUF885 family)